MDNIFQKNILALAQKDKKLADELSYHVLTDVPQLVNENGAYNLKYKDMFLHNIKNPLAEAQEIFARAENSPVAIHLIYGLGLGYLFQITCSYSKGTVILYEPDLNVLKIAFTLVDFSSNIIQNNVYITNSFEKVGEYLYKKSNTGNIPLLLSTDAYRNMNIEQFNKMVEELQTMVGRYSLDLKYTQKKFYQLTSNVINNIPMLVKEIPLCNIRDSFKGETAVVVSAGPTLDRNIDMIKKYRDNIILIVVGTALKALTRHNITPDFLCLIESYDSSKQIEGVDLTNVNFVTEPYTHANVRKYKFKNVFSHISNNLPVNSIWSNLINVNTNEYLSKGTVSYTAINTARILGCSRIVMVGQDLAYIEGQCYSKDSVYKDLTCEYNSQKKTWEITAKNFDEFVNAISNSDDIEIRRKVAENRLRNLNNSLYYVEGIKGDKIPTESVYATFIKPLSEFTEIYNDIEYINTSLVGAQINGFANMSLEEALKNTHKINNRDLDINYTLDLDLLKRNIESLICILDSAKEDISVGQKALKTLNNNVKRYRNPTIEVLQDLKKVSKIFLDISKKYSGNIYGYITAAERIQLDYELKMVEQFDAVVLNKLLNEFSEYFSNAEIKINKMTKLIQRSIERIQ